MADRDRDSFDDYDGDDQDDGFLTFDARDEEEDRSRGTLFIVAIIAVVALCAVIGWQLYSSSKSTGDTPQVAADTSSFKSAPTETTPPAVNDLDKGVYDAADGTAAPALDVLPADGVDEPLLDDGSAAPSAAPLTPSVSALPSPSTKPAPAPKPVVKPAPAPVVKAAPAPAAVSAPPKQAAPKKVAPAPVAKTESASSGGYGAQLGSFQTRAAADAAVAKYRAAGMSGAVSIVAADLGAKGTWHRIRVSGFSNRSEAEGFCAKARSAGAQCIPAAR
jgi:cell division septation protein DedD